MLSAKMIGDKIAAARKRINISQAQLAQRLFISSQAVGKWERGESMPDITTFNSLAEILGVDLNYFSEKFPSETSVVPPAEPLTKEADALLPGTPPKKLSWDMSGGSWVDADFSGLKNLHEKFSGSNMLRTRFIGSELSGLTLKGNHVDNCDFSLSDISNSHFDGSHILSNLFKECSLKETGFSSSHIKGCDFTTADFTGTVFKMCSFRKNTVVNAVWNNTSFNATDLADIVFDGTITDCYFDNSSFARVTFQQVTLINTFFKGKSFKGMQFIDCEADRMTYEFLKNGKADVTGIRLLTQ